jgi:serine/threonine protein kinase
MAFERSANEWKSFRALVKTSTPLSEPLNCYAGELEFVLPRQSVSAEEVEQGAGVSDLEFLMATAIFGSIPRHALLYLINCLQRRTYRRVERLFSQGETGRSLFIIQEGVCVIQVDKDGKTHQASRMTRGEVCGEMAVLTGERRRRHAVAETPMVVWELAAEAFERVSAKHPELRIFLTELITQRLQSWSFTGDRTVGKYTIKHPIGSGGWGIVYHGYHRALNMPVAIKMLKHDMAMDPLFLETFRKEAQTIARLNHQNIVQIFDIDEVYRTIFIIMEYLEGEPLRDILNRRGALTVAETVTYLKQILCGMDYAHGQGIIHRDIKPANIFVLRDGRVKILDFGLACALGEEDLNLHSTLYYASPEQIEGEPEDFRSDIYALGIMAYELLCGKRPYPENDLCRLMDLHCQRPIPDPAEKISDLPEELRAFILKCCAIDPDQRYATAQEALMTIDNLARKLQIHTEFEKRMLTSVLVVYPEKHRQALTRLLEDFSRQLEPMGIVMKTSEAMDI